MNIGALERKGDYLWELPKSYKAGMRVPGLVIGDERLVQNMIDDNAIEQVANVAFLPGIQRHSLAMPDIHWGYGLPIGGVAPIRKRDGVVSPGGVGSDINCGVRLLRTNLQVEDIKGHISDLIDKLFTKVPSGLGSTSKIHLNQSELYKVLRKGAKWSVENGYGWNADLDSCEERGALDGANPDALSSQSIKRGFNQLGTLGSGNHFLEVQTVEKVYNAKVANRLGLEEGTITVMIHTGSRGLGYQVMQDYSRDMISVMNKYNINLPDRQLSSAPIDSPEGRKYLGAMAAAANYAWANRQCITHWVREGFAEVLNEGPNRLGMNLIYDVAHNIAKFEQHKVNGKLEELVIHRKGATRALPPGHEKLPAKYKDIGQPVIIPGDMGTASYLLIGAEKAAEVSFCSTCHGAGRVLSRRSAKKKARGRNIGRELMDKGILLRAQSMKTVSEEMPEAYKNINQIVEIVERVGISSRVVKLKPLAVAKG